MPLQTGNKQSVDWHQPLGHTLKSRMTQYTQNDREPSEAKEAAQLWAREVPNHLQNSDTSGLRLKGHYPSAPQETEENQAACRNDSTTLLFTSGEGNDERRWQFPPKLSSQGHGSLLCLRRKI